MSFQLLLWGRSRFASLGHHSPTASITLWEKSPFAFCSDENQTRSLRETKRAVSGAGGDSSLKYVEQLEGCRGFQRKGWDASRNGSRSEAGLPGPHCTGAYGKRRKQRDTYSF